MITQKQLHAALDYDPLTGIFRWRDRSDIRANVNARLQGTVAGTIRKADGRRQICFADKRYLASRLAWFYVYGKWPNPEVDHINVRKDDDRIANLREASKPQNQRNKKGHRDSASQIKGVTWHKLRRKWRASICIDYRQIHLGLFQTKDLAIAAYSDAAIKFHGDFARLP
jgi:hypothetical protein